MRELRDLNVRIDALNDDISGAEASCLVRPRHARIKRIVGLSRRQSSLDSKLIAAAAYVRNGNVLDSKRIWR
jgi:hypothetical protein